MAAVVEAGGTLMNEVAVENAAEDIHLDSNTAVVQPQSEIQRYNWLHKLPKRNFAAVYGVN